MDRRLAAILATDVVGYSGTWRDEQGTYERLVSGRKELFEPEIAKHRGHIFKLMGDGMLSRVRERGQCSRVCRCPAARAR